MPKPSQSDPAFYDELLGLPEAERDAVIDEMHPDDVAGFLQHMEGRNRPEGAASEAPKSPDTPITLPPNLREAQHPALSTLDRELVQNFASNPVEGRRYIEKTYPDLMARVAEDPGEKAKVTPTVGNRTEGYGYSRTPGQRIIVRSRAAKADEPWYAVDPQTGLNPIEDPAELLKDIADVGYDIPAGAVQAGVGAAGGLGGAAVGGAVGGPVGASVGALGGAGAAGAAAGGTMEAFKQAIGKMLGVNNAGGDPSPTAGYDTAPMKDAAIAGAVSPLIFGTGASPKQAAQAGVTYGSQKGLVTRAARGTTAAVGSFISGIPKKDIVLGRELLPQIKQVEKQGLVGQTEVVEGTQKAIRDALMGNKERTVNELSRILAESGTQVDIRGAREKIQSLIRDIEGAGARGEAMTDPRKEELARAKEILDRYFNVDQEIEVKTPVPQSSADQYLGRPQQFTTEKKTIRVPRPAFVDPQEAFQLKQDLKDLSKIALGNERFQVKGKPHFDKKVESRSGSAWQIVDKGIEQATKGVDNAYGTKGIGPVTQRYRDLSVLERALDPFFDETQDRAFKVLGNLNNPANKMARARIERMDKDFGTNVAQQADLLNAMKTFSDPANTALSGWGATSTSRTGQGASIGATTAALLNAAIGDPSYYKYVVPAGALLGTKAGTPAMLRRYMNAGQVVRNGANFVQRPFGLNLRLPQILGEEAIEETQPSGWSLGVGSGR